jgi:ribosomal protein S17E
VNRRILLITSLFAAALVAAPFIGSSALAAQPKPKEKKEKPEQWAIVQVDEEYQAVRKTDVKQLQKTLTEKYTADLKAWQEHKKEAVKSKMKFDEPKPVSPKVKQMPSTYSSEEAASAAIEKLKAEHDKKKK